MKTKLLVTMAAIGLALLIPSGATAACPVGQIELSNTNVTGFGVTVCLTLSGNTLTVNSISNTSGLTVVGIDQLGYQTSATLVSETDASGVWAPKGGTSPFQMDGFGDFTSEITNPGGTGGSGISWTFSASPGTDLALHIRFSNGCSAFVSNRTATSSNPIGDCAVIPEPGTMALFGSGLVAIAGIIRRRFAA